MTAILDEVNKGDENIWLQLWEQVPGAGMVYPWHLRGIDELQRRFEHWNTHEQSTLQEAYDGFGFTGLDWSGLFGAIPQFNPEGHALPIPIGCYEVWSRKIDRQYDIHESEGKIAIKVDVSTYETCWSTEIPEDGSNRDPKLKYFYATRHVVKLMIFHRLTCVTQ